VPQWIGERGPAGGGMCFCVVLKELTDEPSGVCPTMPTQQPKLDSHGLDKPNACTSESHERDPSLPAGTTLQTGGAVEQQARSILAQPGSH